MEIHSPQFVPFIPIAFVSEEMELTLDGVRLVWVLIRSKNKCASLEELNLILSELWLFQFEMDGQYPVVSKEDQHKNAFLENVAGTRSEGGSPVTQRLALPLLGPATRLLFTKLAPLRVKTSLCAKEFGVCLSKIRKRSGFIYKRTLMPPVQAGPLAEAGLAAFPSQEAFSMGIGVKAAPRGTVEADTRAPISAAAG